MEKVYENAAGKFVALKSINLQLNYGQFISIVGKSGCGKSTLLNMITGIDHPTAGDVIIGNEHIYKMSESKRALWRGRNMGVVFQFFQLLPTLTLLENTMLPMDYCNLYPFYERPDAGDGIAQDGWVGRSSPQTSHGRLQRAAAERRHRPRTWQPIRPLSWRMNPPATWIHVRPTTFSTCLKTWRNSGKTILIVTHDPSITQRTDQTIILSDGEIIDQTVARALPFLSHPQMLAATKRAKKQKVAPGATILQQGEAGRAFLYDRVRRSGDRR